MLLHTVTGFNLATSASIYLPIILMLNYQLLNVPPTNAFGDIPFCENCVMLDPNEPARLVREVSFNTGCRGEICMSDLQLSARWLDIDSDGGYILGSTKKASLEFTVYNNGENAYLPQLNVTLLPARLTLANLTRECRQTVTIESVNVLCDLNRGLPLKASHTAKYTLELDMTKLEGGTVSKAEIRAEALSTSEELVPMDNFYETMLSLREHNKFVFVTKSSVTDVSLDKQKGQLEIEHEVILHNNGPSVSRNIELSVDVPLVYLKPNSGGQTIQLIDKNTIVFSASLGNKTLDYTWIQNGEDLLLNNHGLTASQTNWIDEFLSKLPSGRKLLLSCFNDIDLYGQCARFTVAVDHFHPGNETIVIKLSFRLDLDAVASALDDAPGDIVVLLMMANVQQKRDPAESAKDSRFTLAPNNPYTLVYRYPDRHLTIPTPSNTATGTWVWSLVIIGSVLSSIILH